MDSSDSMSDSLEKWQALLRKELKINDLGERKAILSNGIEIRNATQKNL